MRICHIKLKFNANGIDLTHILQIRKLSISDNQVENDVFAIMSSFLKNMSKNIWFAVLLF